MMISKKALNLSVAIFAGALALAACSSPASKGEPPPVTAGGAKASSNDLGEPPDVNGASDMNLDGGTDAAGAKPAEVSSPSATVATPAPAAGPEKYEALGKAVRSGNGDAIRVETTKILGREAADPVALNATALYYYRKGQIGAAKIVLDKAFEKNPNNASLYNNLGVMNLAQEEQGAAIANFKKALSIDPKLVEASENLGAIYVAGGDYLRAASLLETAYKAKHTASAGVNYAITLRNAKKYPEAEQVYQEVIKNYPRDVNAQLDYALLLIDYLNKPKDGLALVYKVKFLETEKRDVLALTNVLEQKAKSEIKE